MRGLLLCALLLIALPAAAQIYKYIDSEGRTVFTNEPPPGVNPEVIKLAPGTSKSSDDASSAPPPPPPTPTQPTYQAPPSTGEDRDPGPVIGRAYKSIELTGLPEEGGALRANDGNFTVVIMMQPALQPVHSVRLLLDGSPYGEPSKQISIGLTEVDRGEHTLAAEVLDAGGNVIQRSGVRTFTLQRASANGPAR